MSICANLKLTKMNFVAKVCMILLAVVNAEENEPCCQTVFLFATEAVGEHQSALMGKYEFEDFHNERPYYSKIIANKTYYFFFQSADDLGGPAWIVGSELGGLTLNIVTPGDEKDESDERYIGEDCPVGIKGAYDRNETLDESFIVECEDDASTVMGPHCCSVVSVIADGDIKDNHIVRVGTYNMSGIFNGHPLYHLNQYNYDSYLYYRKKGRSADGWTIGSEPGQESFSITTRNRTDCPNQVTTGFDRDRNLDPTFKIICEDEDINEETDDIVDTYVYNNDDSNADTGSNHDNHGDEIAKLSPEQVQPRVSSACSLTPFAYTVLLTIPKLINIF